MRSIEEKKTNTPEVDFSSNLTEGYIKSFAYKVEQILKSMLTGKYAPVSVKGQPDKVKAFAKALGNEERYINALQASNTTDPKVMALRHELEESISNFEKITGIKWPVR
jgi:hypothetical protein